MTVRLFKNRTPVVAAVLALSLAPAACGGATDSGGGEGGGKVAFLLPESKTARYESQDRLIFERKLKEECPDCEILYSNADQDASKQQQQADAALTNGAEVLVLDPVDAASAASMVARAKAQNVPVVSYDRLITGADIDYYISFDNEEVGRLQGRALLDKLRADDKVNAGPIVMINGSPTDNNARQFKAGAHSVLDGQVTIGREYDTPDWSPDHAQRQMEQAITALGRNIIGVYAANDGTAGGAIAAMKAAGFNPIPPTTGQDAELAGIQRILAGEQYMTVYKAVKQEAEQAAELAAAIVQGESIPEHDRTTNNGQKDVPSFIFTPVAVTKDNVEETVIADGFWTKEQVCTPQFEAACRAAGIS